MRVMKPARYAAVMSGAKIFHDPDWRCTECAGNERHTRNLTCRACTGARVPSVFKTLPGGQVVYIPKDANASENWQQRHLRTTRLLDQQLMLNRLGPVQVGRYHLSGGVVLRTGSVQLDTEALMLAVDALLSGDPEQSRAALTPLLSIHRELVLLVRTIAAAVQAGAFPEPNRT